MNSGRGSEKTRKESLTKLSKAGVPDLQPQRLESIMFRDSHRKHVIRDESSLN